jgi:apolipoprotein N-acyltransferase
VQCNIDQNEKNNNYSKRNFMQYLLLSKTIQNIDMIIWPEAAIPYLYQENLKNLHSILADVLNEGSCIISGVVRKDKESEKIYNSAVFINHLGENIGIYDKIHLVPFGEYIPFRSLIPTTFQNIASDIGDFEVGEKSNIVAVKGMKLAIAICFEAVFPDFIRNKQHIDLIVNLTNDGWFGFTSEPFQHLQIVRARAVENGIPLVRSNNYGISALFDGCGRKIAEIHINQSGYIDVHIPKKLKKQTLYVRYGDIPFWITIFLLALISIFMESRNRTTTKFGT